MPGDFVEIGEETLGENSKTPFTDKIYGETCHKNLMHLNGTKRSALRQECVTVDVEKHRATERSMQQKGKEIEDTYIFYGGTINGNQTFIPLPVALTKRDLWCTIYPSAHPHAEFTYTTCVITFSGSVFVSV